LWQKWDIIRAQTGAFDKINFQGMSETGVFDTPPSSMSFFSSTPRSGSSFGELYAWKGHEFTCQERTKEECPSI